MLQNVNLCDQAKLILGYDGEGKAHSLTLLGVTERGCTLGNCSFGKFSQSN